MAETNKFLSRAAEAKRSSKRVELDEGFDPQRPGVWLELVRDVAAMANSGGGVVVLNGDVDPRPRMPQGRWGEPDDAARLIRWLCTDEAQWITGQVIDSEGGFRRWG